MKTNLSVIALFFGVFMTMYGQICDDYAHKKYQQTVIKNAKSSPTDGRISLRLAGNGSFVTILIGFIPEGTVNFDDGYDGPFINDGAAVEFYSFLGMTRLSIQALPELTNFNVQVPLGYELTSDGSYTISIDAEFLSTDFDIILEDTYLNTFTNLRQTSYTFPGITGEIHDRFFLNLDFLSALNTIDSENNSKDILAFFHGDQLKLLTKRTDITQVTLFSMAGKQLFSTAFDNEITIKNIARGMYIMQYTTTFGVQIIKKIVK
ncbi:MAG: T9SS type A sorting domain-containing protein [Bacteroidota bacterium]